MKGHEDGIEKKKTTINQPTRDPDKEIFIVIHNVISVEIILPG